MLRAAPRVLSRSSHWFGIFGEASSRNRLMVPLQPHSASWMSAPTRSSSKLSSTSQRWHDHSCCRTEFEVSSTDDTAATTASCRHLSCSRRSPAVCANSIPRRASSSVSRCRSSAASIARRLVRLFTAKPISAAPATISELRTGSH
ncbi:Uncharacterised protein [Mycobacteroides abscessus subsp. abscessus]|nr:Uncharacterised protein [Mycobacteroides abscessus subsp. abscessus]